MPPSDWTDHHRAALDWFPFASMWLGTRATDRPALTKAIEQLLMAAIAAAAGVWANDKIQDTKLTALTATVAEVKGDTRADIAAIRADIAAMRTELFNHAKKE
jgi:hypothetical protein